MKNKTTMIEQIGQSFWLDFISRDFILKGLLEETIKKYNIKGLTSNPSIFEKAISDSDIYDKDIFSLQQKGLSVKEIYEELAIKDIQMACDILHGHVSMEVSPHLASDPIGTVEEAKKFWQKINRPNLMIKVPGTNEGCIAIEELIYLGININVTLLFSVPQYEKAANAYLSGLHRRLAEGLSVENIHSVASFFISRIDTAVDKLLEKIPGGNPYLGKIAIANAQMAYEKFLEIYLQPKAKGLTPQKLLWASTGTKNPELSQTLYVDNLLAKDTINTMPLKTLEVFFAKKTINPVFEKTLHDGRKNMLKIEGLGLDFNAITSHLLKEGLDIFIFSFDNLLKNILKKISSGL